jgi:hypothetical protein
VEGSNKRLSKSSLHSSSCRLNYASKYIATFLRIERFICMVDSFLVTGEAEGLDASLISLISRRKTKRQKFSVYHSGPCRTSGISSIRPAPKTVDLPQDVLIGTTLSRGRMQVIDNAYTGRKFL